LTLVFPVEFHYYSNPAGRIVCDKGTCINAGPSSFGEYVPSAHQSALLGSLTAGTYGMIRVQAKTINEKFWQPKTKVNRVVPISSALRTWLDRYAPRPSIGGWYFPSPTGYHYDIDNLSHHLAAANHKAGLPWTCLDYRHTFGSQLAMKGESLYKISKLLGNSPEICRLHYAAILPETMLDTVEFSGPKAAANRVSA
jgi:hypothetical protein